MSIESEMILRDLVTLYGVNVPYGAYRDVALYFDRLLSRIRSEMRPNKP